MQSTIEARFSIDVVLRTKISSESSRSSKVKTLYCDFNPIFEVAFIRLEQEMLGRTWESSGWVITASFLRIAKAE